MNRNVLLGAGLSALLAAAVLAITGGRAVAPATLPEPAGAQAPAPNLAGVANPAPAPAPATR